MIFFSMHYPFHFTDSYLDEEINYLASKFDKLIIISNNTHSTSQRAIPMNADLYRFSAFDESKKIYALKHFFNPFFWRELQLLKIRYNTKISFTLVKELLLNLNRIATVEAYLKKIYEQYQLDKQEVLIYTYWFLEAASAVAFYRAKSSKKFTFISKAHSQEIYFFRNYYNYQPYKYQTFLNCDKIYFISNDGLNYFSKIHQLSDSEQKKIEINRIGVVGIDSFIAQRMDSKLKIISIAWLHKLKRIELIAEAIAKLTSIEIEWIHLGSSIDEPYTNKLQFDIANKLDHLKNVNYSFLGETNKEKMKEIFEKNCFDIFVNVSETEGIPVSMMEAASFSVPLFGTNVGGVSEIIEHEINGILFEPNPTGEDIANSFLKFYQKSMEEKNTMRKNSFLTWKNKYNVFENKQKLFESIQSIN